MNTINILDSFKLDDLNESTSISSKTNFADKNFVSELKTALDNISQLQIQTNNEAKAFEMGDANISLNEVMVNMQKSSVSLQFGIQVRNKLVAAYQEIMNMNV
ncbi:MULTISPECIES: flagellar hook-basal body complex protein FliE [unclassified Gilliamella]|uniref:flagellar hook-basal body complex protein FliE n=1 Tax=unclassified Gilliamella TaxID=2685620 RepID=UPI000461EC90|nr:flagellar hook-basal body complex protein FliE [Gilliamella apicola]KDN11348.1 Flagellar hook-basal body complex protein FliE [Gilliamella apicola]OCG57491.1 flagellar hook-basal body complex protein FliE [Gilliamella apicola]OCG63432.1 flagellar hook-basal body complex protein FliE [Gilliamella apicola]OCG66142.1 flagellar hook-basal body complex protein FliE [Gilliamella apicola]